MWTACAAACVCRTVAPLLRHPQDDGGADRYESVGEGEVDRKAGRSGLRLDATVGWTGGYGRAPGRLLPTPTPLQVLKELHSTIKAIVRQKNKRTADVRTLENDFLCAMLPMESKHSEVMAAPPAVETADTVRKDHLRWEIRFLKEAQEFLEAQCQLQVIGVSSQDRASAHLRTEWCRPLLLHDRGALR